MNTTWQLAFETFFEILCQSSCWCNLHGLPFQPSEKKPNLPGRQCSGLCAVPHFAMLGQLTCSEAKSKLQQTSLTQIREGCHSTRPKTSKIINDTPEKQSLTYLTACCPILNSKLTAWIASRASMRRLLAPLGGLPYACLSCWADSAKDWQRS